MAMSWIERRQLLSTPANACFSTTFESSCSISSLVWSRAIVLERRWSRDRCALSGWQCIFQCPAFTQSCSKLFFTTHYRWPLPKHIPRPELFPGGSAFAAWKLTLRCYNFVVFEGESYGRPTKFLRDLLASVAPKKNESKQANQIFKSSSTKFAPLVGKAPWSARRKCDWKETAKSKATYSKSATTRLCCSSVFRSYHCAK